MTEETYPDTHHDSYSKTVFGFWLYLITDFMMFATVFAAFAVLRNNFYGGEGPKELFDLDAVMLQTYMMLGASFAAGLGGVAAHRKKFVLTQIWFLVAMIFSGLFLYMMWDEFARLIASGNDWTRSAYLSAYFTLEGMLALHVIVAIVWTIFFKLQMVLWGFTKMVLTRLTCLRLLYQFINVLWIFMYSVIYLMGVA